MISDNASTYQSHRRRAAETHKIPKPRDTPHLIYGAMEIHSKTCSLAWWFLGTTHWSSKVALTKVLGRANIRLPELETIVTEIEAILNDRPLTFISCTIDDEQPLTPSHLLYGRRITALPHPLIKEDEWSDPTCNEDPSLVQHLAKFRADLIHQFWNLWRRDYLTSLREFPRTSGKNKVALRVGDVVQVHDDTKRIN